MELPSQHLLLAGLSDDRAVPGYMQSIDDNASDLGFYVLSIRKKHPGLRVFLIGESMGGAVSLASVLPGGRLHGKVDGIITVAPMCQITPDVCR